MNMLKFKPRGTRLELRLFYYAHVDGRHSHPILAFVGTTTRGEGGGGDLRGETFSFLSFIIGGKPRGTRTMYKPAELES